MLFNFYRDNKILTLQLFSTKKIRTLITINSYNNYVLFVFNCYTTHIFLNVIKGYILKEKIRGIN